MPERYCTDSMKMQAGNETCSQPTINIHQAVLLAKGSVMLYKFVYSRIGTSWLIKEFYG